jgi:hypothetical protein
VFPLLDMHGNISVHLEESVRAMSKLATLEIATVPFEFRDGDSRMLRIRR